MSCVFLFDACRRIIAVTRRNPALKINIVAMSIHLGSYVLYLVSLVYFFFTSLMVNPRFLLSEILKTAFSSLSQILICYVFWSIYKLSLVPSRSNFLKESIINESEEITDQTETNQSMSGDEDD